MSIRLGIDMRAKGEEELVCARVETAQCLEDAYPPSVIGISYIADSPLCLPETWVG